MRSRYRWVLACALAVSGQACRRAAVDAGGVGGATSTGRPAAGSSGAVSADASSLERARELCHALQAGPAERRAACCGGLPSGHFETSCVRELGLALEAGRIALDAAGVDRCTAASERALEGCDWVTPGQPVPPVECQGVTVGRVALGGACRSSLECEGQLHCEGSSPTRGGRCAAPKAPPAPCAPPADALATYLFARDLEREHPTCAGTCSLLTHRCEAGPSNPIPDDGRQRGRGSKRSGEPCQTDFDCSQGGCNGNPGTCGMKCAVSLADRARASELPPLSLPSKPSKPGKGSGEARSPQGSKITVP